MQLDKGSQTIREEFLRRISSHLEYDFIVVYEDCQRNTVALFNSLCGQTYTEFKLIEHFTVDLVITAYTMILRVQADKSCNNRPPDETDYDDFENIFH